jgi:hypothetical protein
MRLKRNWVKKFKCFDPREEVGKQGGWEAGM